MAEATREEEEVDYRAVSVLRSSNLASENRLERNKPEPFLSSPGPLSSIRAAFKRTSARAHSQSDSRDRRRPEITILSAEPLSSNTWFPGAAGGFPPSPSSSPARWGGSFSTTAQPPPSYDQVIKEKTQETVATPTPPPRNLHTSSISTQTESAEERVCSNSRPAERKEPGGSLKRPTKPPRPSLPGKPKPVLRGATVNSNGLPTQRPTTTTLEGDIHYDINAVSPSTKQAFNDQSSPESVSSEPSRTALDSPSEDSDNTIITVIELTPRSRPVPLPRSKTKHALTQEVKVQTLVRIQDSSEDILVIPPASSPAPSGKYLRELLDVFGSDPHSDLSNSDDDQDEETDQSREGGDNMSATFSERNIRSRIQAFENHTSADEANAPVPLPKPRNNPKPPVVAPKPSVVPRTSVKRPTAEGVNDDDAYEEVNYPPAPAPRPVASKRPSIVSKEEPGPQQPVKCALLPPPRPSLARAPSFDEDRDFKGPPPPVKPSKELLNQNNHNSTALPHASTHPRQENVYADQPRGQTPVKPLRGPGGSIHRPSVSRKPTMIRVPSKAGKQPEEGPDFPPPLPTQNPVGGAPPLVKPSSFKHNLQSQDPLSASMNDVSLPPRPGGGKALPPRPPPAKPGPGRPPPPRKDGPQHAPSSRGGAGGAGGALQGLRPSKRGPVLPPRPCPGHRLYNKYTLEIPHAIAQFDHTGRGTEELSFQKNEVLVLLEHIDNKTFRCQAGDAKGSVQKSYLKIITPLATPTRAAEPEQSRSDPFSGVHGDHQVQALYDFTAEGPGELGLRAGDVVSGVEQLDSEWYLGTCRGTTGFFPITHVQTLNQSSSPAAPMREQRAKPEPAAISGPRCVARFDFEGERSDELSFSEGEVISLVEYVSQDWANGELGSRSGIFPLSFVEIVEDLPPPPAQKAVTSGIALPGMTASTKVQETPSPIQPGGEEWAMALYDFTAETDQDLPFHQGDYILVTAHLDEEWWAGRVNGREGCFPKTYVEPCSG